MLCKKCHFQMKGKEKRGGGDGRHSLPYVSNSFNIERTILLSCYFWETCLYIVNLTVNVVVLS